MYTVKEYRLKFICVLENKPSFTHAKHKLYHETIPIIKAQNSMQVPTFGVRKGNTEIS